MFNIIKELLLIFKWDNHIVNVLFFRDTCHNIYGFSSIISEISFRIIPPEEKKWVGLV